MCFPVSDPSMLSWLKTQVRVLEAWREDVATRSEIDLELLTRLEHHYQWLTAEISHLEDLSMSTLKHSA